MPEIKIYDSKKKQKVNFEPIKENEVSMYVCGPTVYNRIHVGNARTFMSFDVIRRYLLWRGFKVTFVQNVTDVDDKIIARAHEEGVSAEDIAQTYTEAFMEDMHSLNVLDPDIRPKATQEIPEMISLIEELIKSGHAYEVEGDVYFDVYSFAEYGQLSGRSVEDAESGHRELRASGQGLEDRKRSQEDFALWKAAKEGEPSWESPWGYGRPGWHIECSAMSKKYLGLPFDIHGGGVDLIFPHHENERAQSMAAYNQGFANYWMHSGMLRVNSEKMSKSLGNFLLLDEVLAQTSADVLRLLVLQTHYRSALDYSAERIHDAQTALERIENTLSQIDWRVSHAGLQDDNATSAQASAGATEENTEDSGQGSVDLRNVIDNARANFVAHMDDDFNSPAALGEIFSLVSAINQQLESSALSSAQCEILQNAQETIIELLGVFGLNVGSTAQDDNDVPEEILILAAKYAEFSGSDKTGALNALLQARTQARSEKDFATADAIRDDLLALGFSIEDTPQGPKLVRK